jgi:hypothetical protein
MSNSRSFRPASKRFTRDEWFVLTLAAIAAIAAALPALAALAGHPTTSGFVERTVSIAVCVGSLMAALDMKMRRAQAENRESGYRILAILTKASAGLALWEIEAALIELGDVTMEDDGFWRNRRLAATMRTLERFGHVERSGAIFYKVVHLTEK